MGFGGGIAISSDRIFIGAEYFQSGGGFAGKVYMFSQDGKRELQSFQGSNTIAGDNFGTSASASGGTLVIDHALPVQMRTKPSVSLTTQNLRCGDTVAQGFTTTSGTVSLNTYSGSASVTYVLGGFSGMTSYRTYLSEPDAASNGIVQFDAEL